MEADRRSVILVALCGLLIATALGQDQNCRSDYLDTHEDCCFNTHDEQDVNDQMFQCDSLIESSTVTWKPGTTNTLVCEHGDSYTGLRHDCTWHTPSGDCTYSVANPNLVCSDPLISWAGENDADGFTVCAISVSDANKQHESTWSCEFPGQLPYKDNIRVVVKDDAMEPATVAAIVVPVVLIVVLIIALIVIFCCFPVLWASIIACICCKRNTQKQEETIPVPINHGRRRSSSFFDDESTVMPAVRVEVAPGLNRTGPSPGMAYHTYDLTSDDNPYASTSAYDTPRASRTILGTDPNVLQRPLPTPGASGSSTTSGSERHRGISDYEAVVYTSAQATQGNLNAPTQKTARDE